MLSTEAQDILDRNRDTFAQAKQALCLMVEAEVRNRVNTIAVLESTVENAIIDAVRSVFSDIPFP